MCNFTSVKQTKTHIMTQNLTKTEKELLKLEEKTLSFLNQKTRKQRNNYYGAVVEFNKNRIEDYLTRKEDSKDEFTKIRLQQAYDYESQNFNINLIQWLDDAKNYFDNKLKAIIKTIKKHKMLNFDVRLDWDTFESDSGLEFYIECSNANNSEKLGRIHSRLIWVECYEKASHYRFITTFKKA